MNRRIQRQDLDYWQIPVEERFNELFPEGLTQEQVDEASREMWRNCYPTFEMSLEEEQEQ